MPGSLGQPVIILPLLSLWSHQKGSYKQQKLILLWICSELQPAKQLVYCICHWSCPQGKSYTRQELLCALSCMYKAWLHENYRVPWCRQVHERHHYYFSNYIGFLEMYLFVPLNYLFSLFLYQKTKHSCLRKSCPSFIDTGQAQHLKITSKKTWDWAQMTKVRLHCLEKHHWIQYLGFKNMSFNISQVQDVSPCISWILITATKLLIQAEPFLDGFEINLKEIKLNTI